MTKQFAKVKLVSLQQLAQMPLHVCVEWVQCELQRRDAQGVGYAPDLLEQAASRQSIHRRTAKEHATRLQLMP